MSMTDCKSESPQEALERFEEAVRQQEQYQSDIHHYGESDIDISDETINLDLLHTIRIENHD